MPRGQKTRAHGQGSIWTEKRANGRTVFVGQVRVGNRQFQRLLGDVRKAGVKDGLTRAGAEARLREIRAEIEATIAQQDTVVGDASTTLLSHVAERHFEYLHTVLGRRKRTVDDYRSMLRVHILPFFGDVPPAPITRKQVEAFMAEVVASGRTHGTMLNVVNLLHAICEEAVRDDLAPVNVVSQARRPRTPKANKKIRFLTPEEVAAVIRHVPEDDFATIDRLLYHVAAWTGLRQGELVALRWGNVDFPAMQIRVHESFSDGVLTDPKSFRSIRAVPMIEEVARALARERERDRWTGDDDLVFAHPHTGRYLSAQRIIDRFKDAVRAAGMGDRLGRGTGITFHSLRHTFGTQMAAGGVPLRAIQEWMGHANQQTTEIYAAYAPSDVNRGLAERAFARVNNGEATADVLAAAA